MKNAEKKASELMELFMVNSFDQDRYITVHDLLNILDPEDFVEAGYADELRECREKCAGNLDDELIAEIDNALETRLA